MLIGELAKRTGASVRSLRHYEAMGLIAAERRENGYREFDEGAVERVRRIRALLANGFTLEDILPLSACLDAGVDEHDACDDAIATYRDKLRDIDMRIAELREMRQRIHRRLERLQSHRLASAVHD